MISYSDKIRIKELALLYCNTHNTGEQKSLNSHKTNNLHNEEVNFAERFIAEMLAFVYRDVKNMSISEEEGRIRQKAILEICEIEEDMEE